MMDMPTADPEDFWRKQIDKLSSSLPEDGKPSPEIESIKKKPITNDGARRGVLQRVVTTVFVFTDLQGKMYTGDVSQQTQIFGNMTLAKAIKIMQQDKLT